MSTMVIHNNIQGYYMEWDIFSLDRLHIYISMFPLPTFLAKSLYLFFGISRLIANVNASFGTSPTNWSNKDNDKYNM